MRGRARATRTLPSNSVAERMLLCCAALLCLQEEVAQAAAAISRLGGELQLVGEVDSEGIGGRCRTAVLVKKVLPTPAQYPRPPGTPKKMPL